MGFDPESIEQLSPAARVEVQDYYARKYLADRQRHFPERRVAARRAPAAPPVATPASTARPRWPRAVWFRNDSSRVGAQTSPKR